MNIENLVIYRNLPFEVWHKPYKLTGSTWRIGGYRDQCDCPYGSHLDQRYLDYKDPLHLEKILSLKKGMKLLTLYSWKGTEHVAFHTFEKFEFLSDFTRLVFKERVSVYEKCDEEFNPVRLIAVIDDANEITAFAKRKGGIDVFIKELSKLTGISIQEIRQHINELNEAPIPIELKLSTKEITENVEKAGTYVMHM